ncbi:hypothetical protein [Paenibacillus jiagnxiensis]|uniref:hypothetical protein n=1 Tax=Paenibacillus jiagnxiensis TaxID=3228926 RepID=UPI0033A48397
MKIRNVFTLMLSLVLLFALSVSAFASETDRQDREGVLPNGLKYKIHYLTDEEIADRENAVKPFSYSWSGNVNVPISNAAGTNGKQLGKDFVIGPDTTAIITVGSLPSTMPTVNVAAAATNGMWTDWIPNVGGNSEITFEPGDGYEYYSYAVKVSTSENASKSASFSIETE